MAARTITMSELGAAVAEYAARHELTMSSNEKGFCLMPGDVIITLSDGKPSCSNPAIQDSLVEIDVSGLSLIEAEKAFRTFRFYFGSTDAHTPALMCLVREKEVDEE